MSIRFKIPAFIVLALFAAIFDFGAFACSSFDEKGAGFEDMTDEDAANLYAALPVSDGYEGSFTVTEEERGCMMEPKKCTATHTPKAINSRTAT